MLKRSSTALAVLFASSCVLHSTPAAAETFTFTATGPGAPAVATLTGTADPFTPGAFDITAGSGTLNGTPITLYTPGGTSTSFQTANFTSPPFAFNSIYEYDNVVYTGSSGLALDVYGLLFSSATDHFNPFGAGTAYAYTNDETLFGFNSPLNSVTLTPAASSVTPEPSSIALLGTGLLGTVGLLRRRVAV